MTIFGTALLAGVLIGLLSGIVGTLVVLRQRAFFTVALTHATFPGGVLAAVLGIHIVAGALIMGLALVAAMLLLGRIRRQGRQVAAGIVLSFGYALGVLLHSLAPGLQTRVDSLLTGSITGLAPSSIALMAGMLGLAVLALAVWWKPMLYSTFDRAGFVGSGGNEAAVEALTLVLIVGTVVTTMPAIGSILAIAMLAAPAAAANLLVRRVAWLIPLACALGVGAAVLGLYCSQWFSLAAGGSIALAATAVFVVALLVRRGIDAVPARAGRAAVRAAVREVARLRESAAARRGCVSRRPELAASATTLANVRSDTQPSAPRRNTRQREAVRAALAKQQGFVSAQELHHALVDAGDKIGLATVYRALAQLSEDGEADTMHAPDGELYRSCGSDEHHHHLVCRECGHTVEFEAPEVEAWAAQAANAHGFTALTHDFEVFGLCANCSTGA